MSYLCLCTNKTMLIVNVTVNEFKSTSSCNILNTVLSISFDNTIFLFDVFFPIKEIFTHKETSSLPVKSCKFRNIFGTHGNRAETFL